MSSQGSVPAASAAGPVCESCGRQPEWVLDFIHRGAGTVRAGLCELCRVARSRQRLEQLWNQLAVAVLVGGVVWIASGSDDGVGWWAYVVKAWVLVHVGVMSLYLAASLVRCGSEWEVYKLLRPLVNDRYEGGRGRSQ